MGVGFEGAGEVVEVGNGVDATLVGKKVAFSQNPHSKDYEGTWRQFISVHHKAVMTYPDTANYDHICSSFVNPVTVCGFLDICQKNGVKAVIQDAAASALGKMFNRICKDHNITVINIVRKEEQVTVLNALGATHILNSSTESFWNDLEQLIAILQPTYYFSAIGGGDLPGKVLVKMPAKSTCYVYGALGGDFFHYKPGNFIFKMSTVTFFWLGVWLETLTKEERVKWFSLIVSDISSGGKYFDTTLGKKFKLSEFKEAIKNQNENATEGKTIIHP